MGKVTIIAEIGVNHDGDYNKALQMVTAARLSGVNIVKFQHYDAAKLLGKDSPYYEYAKQCQFSKAVHEEIKRYCDSVGMEYLVSVFDVNDIPWADSLCKRHKVASRMNKDGNFVNDLWETGKPLIISVAELPKYRFPRTEYMYCITKYPTALEDMTNLPCSKDLGLSSHCPSIAPSLRAVALGATLIEHHVCFDRNESGCDKSSSITFDELKQLNRFVNEMAII